MAALLSVEHGEAQLLHCPASDVADTTHATHWQPSGRKGISLELRKNHKREPGRNNAGPYSATSVCIQCFHTKCIIIEKHQLLNKCIY